MSKSAVSHAGRVALVTGASSGVGECIAMALAENGARLVLGARRQDRLDELVAKIETAGGEATAVHLDVTEEESVMAAFDAAEERFGTVDTVLANAGINVDGPATKITMDQFDAVQAVNSRGVFMTVREAGKRLIAAGPEVSWRGRVLVLASMGGLHALDGLVAYCASKASAVMLARGFAKEWARFGICVNALCPGYMLTEINEDWFESERGKKMVDAMPRSRLMPVDGLLPSALYLTSDEGAYATGAVLQLNDGQIV